MASTTLPTISQVTPAQKRTLIAAALGWGLDGFDVLLYSNVQIHVMTALGIHSKAIAGLPNAFMLLASGIGGVLFGFIADRIGRTKALMLSILTYSLCSLGSGFSTSIVMLITFRFVLGLGMGASDCHCAERVGVGAGCGGRGGVDCARQAAPELALCLFCGGAAGAGNAMDQAKRT
jgi:MFS family permease